MDVNNPRTNQFVSVVVIVLNGVKTIGPCLDSLLSQTYPQDCTELIVVDNGSTDGTVELVKQYPVRLVHEPIRGYASARNAGVRAARGGLIAYTDSDCVVEPNWLDELLRPFGDPRIGLVGGDTKALFTSDSSPVENFVDSAGFVGPPRQTIGGILPFVTTQNVAYRKQVVEAAGGFNTNLPSCEDVEISRIIQVILGYQAVITPKAVVYHRHYHTVARLRRFMRRNGYGEILMAARWRGYSPFHTTAAKEVFHLLRQVFVLFKYIISIVVRFFRGYNSGREPLYRLFPVYFFWAESANIIGKLEALWDTRLLKYVPGGLPKA